MGQVNETVRNYGTNGPHVTLVDRLPWNVSRLQPAGKAVQALEEEFAKITDGLRGITEYTTHFADGHIVRITRVGREGFWLTRSKILNSSLSAGEVVIFSKDRKITSVEPVVNRWIDDKHPILSKELLVEVLTQVKADLTEVITERQTRIASSKK